MESDKYIVLFDGVCNLCSSVVSFVIDHDPEGKFLFASLQSTKAQELLVKEQSSDGLDTMVLIKDGEVFLRSTAALKIAKELSGLWPALYGFIVLPTFLRDYFYKLVANNRYRLFGKQDQCRVPGSELTNHFLLD